MSCGQNCACGRIEKIPEETCADPVTAKKEVMLDINGKCPCGKSAHECCHKKELLKDAAPS